MNLKDVWPFSRRRGGENAKEIVLSLYSAAVAQARVPELYLDFGVPDSLDGRFDMISLHVFLIMRRLRAEGDAAQALSQALAELMFDDMDNSLREMGVGDMGVGRRVRQMAEAFYGRVAAYDAALRDGQAGDLDSALLRNVYRGAAPGAGQLAGLADCVRRQAAALDGQPFAAIAAGQVVFADVRVSR